MESYKEGNFYAEWDEKGIKYLNTEVPFPFGRQMCDELVDFISEVYNRKYLDLKEAKNV